MFITGFVRAHAESRAEKLAARPTSSGIVLASSTWVNRVEAEQIMNNAQNNESQDKQTERAADSPLKKPETETAHANTADVAAAAASNQNQAGPRQDGEIRKAS